MEQIRRRLFAHPTAVQVWQGVPRGPMDPTPFPIEGMRMVMEKVGEDGIRFGITLVDVPLVIQLSRPDAEGDTQLAVPQETTVSSVGGSPLVLNRYFPIAELVGNRVVSPLDPTTHLYGALSVDGEPGGTFGSFLALRAVDQFTGEYELIPLQFKEDSRLVIPQLRIKPHSIIRVECQLLGQPPFPLFTLDYDRDLYPHRNDERDARSYISFSIQRDLITVTRLDANFFDDPDGVDVWMEMPVIPRSVLDALSGIFPLPPRRREGEHPPFTSFGNRRSFGTIVKSGRLLPVPIVERLVEVLNIIVSAVNPRENPTEHSMEYAWYAPRSTLTQYSFPAARGYWAIDRPSLFGQTYILLQDRLIALAEVPYVSLTDKQVEEMDELIAYFKDLRKRDLAVIRCRACGSEISTPTGIACQGVFYCNEKCLATLFR